MSDSPTDQEHRGDMTARLAAAAEAVRDAVDAADAARELRDQLVIEAIDEGMSTPRVARAAGVSQSRVMAILARS